MMPIKTSFGPRFRATGPPACLLAVAVAAAPPLAAQPAGPALILEDSVVLQEKDDNFLGRPMEMFVGDDGSIFVIDALAGSVLRFGRSGRHIRTYGRRGEGPGEFSHIGIGGFASSGVLGVADGNPPTHQELEFFDLRSGEHVSRVDALGLVTALAAHDRQLWVGTIDPGTWKTLAAKPIRTLLGGSGPITPDRVPVPKPYMVNELIMGMLGVVRLHIGEDDLVVGFSGSPFVLRATHEGEVLDTIPLLAARRRGVPDEDRFIESMRLDDETTYEELFRVASVLVNLSRGSGYVFTVHADSELHGQQVTNERMYISSLKEDGTDQCPDTPIPTSDVGQPATAFQGSSLFVLDQRIEDEGPQRLRTVVRRFTVDPLNCTGQVQSRPRR